MDQEGINRDGNDHKLDTAPNNSLYVDGKKWICKAKARHEQYLSLWADCTYKL